MKQFSLLLEVEPVGDEIKIRATYKEELLPTKQVDSLLAQLSHLISAITNNPAGTFKQLLAEAPAEILSIANPFPELIPQPSTRTLATCFEDSAAAYPDHVALEMTLDIRDGQAETIPLTYTQLNCASNQLAGALVSRGVKPDDLVAVFMEKSLFCYVAILATVKAGAGYLPLQHETPTERARAILVAAGVKILLATPDLIERLGEIEGVEMINIFSLDLSEFPDENLGIQASSKGLAYAVFTSGSTGVPKGVLVEHEQAVGMLDILAEMYPTAPGKRLLQFCNIAFDVSVFEIFFAWHRGMVLSSATKDVLLRNMEEAVNAMHVTHLSMTPTVAALMRPENVPRVEFLVTSGEAVTKKVFNDWAGHGLWQGYGPSETTNICTVNPAVEAAHDISNIGPPFANTSAFVVAADEDELVLLPAGSVGELCFGGVQVCRGYLNMPELTARKFMTHPVYGRIYRSGDMGRILPNDDIIFQGRQDDQVKIRGQRIELGEINSILLKDRSVVVDAVTLVINKDNSPQLVSFVVPTEFQKSEFGVVDAKEVRETVNRLFRIVPEFVPAYMVPNSIIAVSEIPMTVQGKTDKRILTSSFLSLDSASLDLFSGGDGVEVDGEEWTETERTVAAIVAKVAHADLDTVGRNTSIFNLGLDSISAIQLSIQLKAAGFQRLDISQIMKNAKISSLARLVSEDEQKEVSTSVDSGVAALAEFSASVKESVLEQLKYEESEIQKILPCTPLQESTLSSKVGADPRTYYNHTIFTLHADPSRLHAAWSKLVETHEILRTCFAVTSHPRHAFAQVVVNSHQLAWSSYEVMEKEMKNRIEEHITEVSEGMDITRPPYAFGVFKAEKETRLIMSFHHSLYDGFAMDLLLENVQKAYNDADITFNLTPFDAYLAYMESVDMEKADEFWKQTLSGLEPTSFPDLTGKSNAARKKLSGMTSQRVASSIPLSTITSGCQELSTSLLALGQSAWARLLSVYTGEQDVCFGNVVSGRTIPVDGVEGIIAPCFNTIPLRVTVSSEATTGDIMDKLMDMNNDAMPYQLTPLRRIMAVMKTEGAQLFDTLFILQSAGGGKGESLWEEEEDRGEMDVSTALPRPHPDGNE
jgi:amino acid adenylation domain-containing protein